MAGKPVARLGDTGSHGGAISTGASTIFVNNKPIARVGDTYSCPKHGPNPIVTGAPSVFGQGQLVAHVGSKTACGATITSGSQDTFVDVVAASYKLGSNDLNFFEKTMRFFFGEPDPHYSGKNLSDEEVCKSAKAANSSPQVMEGLNKLRDMSEKEGVEYSAFIVEDPAGQYRLEGITTDNERGTVDPGDKPPNAIGQVHTHVYDPLADPSDMDRAYIRAQKDKCIYYMVLSTSGRETIQNDEGKVLQCP